MCLGLVVQCLAAAALGIALAAMLWAPDRIGRAQACAILLVAIGAMLSGMKIASAAQSYSSLPAPKFAASRFG